MLFDKDRRNLNRAVVQTWRDQQIPGSAKYNKLGKIIAAFNKAKTDKETGQVLLDLYGYK